MQWIHLCGKSGYIETKYALIPYYYLNDGEILLFDSGVQRDEEMLRSMEERHLRVRAVVSSHLHVDHVANNPELIRRYGTEIFADPAGLPFLRERLKEEYPVTPLEGGRPLVIDGAEIRVVPTPGHCAGHVALVTPDGVCYAGDALMAGADLRQAKLPYMEDVEQAIDSMEVLRQLRCPFYVVAHKGAVRLEEMPALVDENIRKELDIYDLLRQQLKTPKKKEAALVDFMAAAEIRPETMKIGYIRQTASARLDALIHAGEYYVKDEIVYPV